MTLIEIHAPLIVAKSEGVQLSNSESSLGLIEALRQRAWSLSRATSYFPHYWSPMVLALHCLRHGTHSI